MSDQLSSNVLFAEDSNDFWSNLDKVVNEGSIGTVLKVNFGFGWKVFTMKDDGFSPEETIFVYNANGSKEETKASLKEARNKANRFVVENGLDKTPYNVFFMHLMKDTCVNRELSWENDKWVYLFPRSYAYSELVMPAVRDAFQRAELSPSLGTYWMSISWGEDTGAKRMNEVQKRDSEGNVMLDENGEAIIEKRWPLVPYPTNIFPDADSALEYCGDAALEDMNVEDMTEQSNELEIPDGFDAETWKATVAEIKTELEKGTKPEKIAGDYGLEQSIIDQIKNF